MWIIQDWTGKRCFDARSFDSFEGAWAFIYETDPQPTIYPFLSGNTDEHWFDDYYVIETETESGAEL